MSQEQTPAGEQADYNPYAPPRADQAWQPPVQPVYQYPQAGYVQQPASQHSQQPAQQAQPTGYAQPGQQQPYGYQQQPGYVQPPYGYVQQPGYPTGPIPPRKKSLAWLWILLGVVAALVIGAIVLGVLFFQSLGQTDELYSSCSAGDAQACEELYQESDAGSDEEWFGQTCGGRTDGTVSCDSVDMTQPANSYQESTGAGTATEGWSDQSTEADPDFDDSWDDLGLPQPGQPAPGTVPELDSLWESCAAGDMAACDELFNESYDRGYDNPTSVGYEYYDYGLWCGGDPDRMWELTCEP